MGIDINRFGRLPPVLAKHLKCSICLNIFDKPMFTQCKHMYCLQCITQRVAEKADCPQCRQPLAANQAIERTDDLVVIDNNIPLMRYRLAESLINDLTIKCDYAAKGCQEVIEFGSMSTHLNTCPFNLCPKCGFVTGIQSQHNCIDLLKQKVNELKQIVENLSEESITKDNVDIGYFNPIRSYLSALTGSHDFVKQSNDLSKDLENDFECMFWKQLLTQIRSKGGDDWVKQYNGLENEFEYLFWKHPSTQSKSKGTNDCVKQSNEISIDFINDIKIACAIFVKKKKYPSSLKENNLS